MSALDRFLDALRLNPDEGYEDDYEDDDYGLIDPNEVDEREQKRQAAKERKAALREQKAREKEEARLAKEQQKQEEFEERERRKALAAVEADKPKVREQERENGYDRPVTAFRSSERQEKPSRPSSKITPMTAKPTPRKQSFSMDEVCVIKPTDLRDETEISDTILSGKPVIINMEGIDGQLAQRIVDFTLGATYAINGNFQRITNYIFLATPHGVDISGDVTAENDLAL